jgi:hypothetical protein
MRSKNLRVFLKIDCEAASLEFPEEMEKSLAGILIGACDCRTMVVYGA